MALTKINFTDNLLAEETMQQTIEPSRYSASPPFLAVVLCRLLLNTQAIVEGRGKEANSTGRNYKEDFHTILNGLQRQLRFTFAYNDMRQCLNQCLEILLNSGRQSEYLSQIRGIEKVLAHFPDQPKDKAPQPRIMPSTFAANPTN